MRLRLATKVTATITGVVALAVLSSLAALVMARHIGGVMRRTVVENVASLEAAEELEIALLEQRGFVTSYILDDGRREWLDELQSREPAFQRWLAAVRATAHTRHEREILEQVERLFEEYDRKRDEAVRLFDEGELEEAKRVILRDVKAVYDQAHKLCEEYVATNQRIVKKRTDAGQAWLQQITLIVTACVVLTITAGGGLLLFFFRGVLLPLRRIAAEARTATGTDASAATQGPRDELREVGGYLRVLMSDMAETRSNLERSREQLVNTEKLATVGKLAASVAHEIRNPLTAVKMWLFSIRKAVGPGPELEHKFDIVSEEINRLESIIRNFLQFTRPPELNLVEQRVPVLIDKTLELIGQKLDEREIRLVRDCATPLPPVHADAEQIKQVFINLLNNAVEAMPDGGEVRLRASNSQQLEGRDMVVVQFADTGPGMTPDAKSRIFEPFFTTKDEGTGLGLCIAARIMERHGGRLVLESSTERGTTFAVWIPVSQDAST